MKPARTTGGDTGQRAANRPALHIPSFKLPPSHHQSTQRGDADARNSVLNSCPKQSRIVSACNFVDYCGCLLIFCANCRANTLRLLSCCICLARYRSRSLGAHSNRAIYRGSSFHSASPCFFVFCRSPFAFVRNLHIPQRIYALRTIAWGLLATDLRRGVCYSKRGGRAEPWRNRYPLLQGSMSCLSPSFVCYMTKSG